MTRSIQVTRGCMGCGEASFRLGEDMRMSRAGWAAARLVRQRYAGIRHPNLAAKLASELLASGVGVRLRVYRDSGSAACKISSGVDLTVIRQPHLVDANPIAVASDKRRLQMQPEDARPAG